MKLRYIMNVCLNYFQYIINISAKSNSLNNQYLFALTSMRKELINVDVFLKMIHVLTRRV